MRMPGRVEAYLDKRALRLKEKYNFKYRKKLKNKDFSIITNFCIGGYIYHDLELEFSSPFINLYIYPADFLKICSNLREYLSYKVVQVESKLPYPVGLLNDVKLYFVHYHSFEEVYEAWNRRLKRINYNKIFVFVSNKNADLFDNSQSSECESEVYEQFKKLSYPNKILFCNNKKYHEDCFVYLKQYKNKPFVEFPTQINIHGKRQYEEGFDLIEFLNRGTSK